MRIRLPFKISGGGRLDTQFALSLLVAYLLGSIPFAYLIAHNARGVNIRTIGDGNPGGKNVFERISPRAGVAVALLDIGKGMSALLLARAQGVSEIALLGVGGAVIVGHNWSLFLHFHGGQGMATTVGVFLTLLPWETLAGILIIALVLWLTHNWDLSCGIGFASLPVWARWNARSPELIIYVIALLPLIGVRKWIQRGSVARGEVARLPRLR